jgi:hypothetical protein
LAVAAFWVVDFSAFFEAFFVGGGAAFFVLAVAGFTVALAATGSSVTVTVLAAVMVAAAFFVLPVGCFFPAGAAAPLIFSMAKMQGFRIAKIAKLMCKSNTTDKKMKIKLLG